LLDLLLSTSDECNGVHELATCSRMTPDFEASREVSSLSSRAAAWSRGSFLSTNPPGRAHCPYIPRILFSYATLLKQSHHVASYQVLFFGRVGNLATAKAFKSSVSIWQACRESTWHGGFFLWIRRIFAGFPSAGFAIIAASTVTEGLGHLQQDLTIFTMMISSCGLPVACCRRGQPDVSMTCHTACRY